MPAEEKVQKQILVICFGFALLWIEPGASCACALYHCAIPAALKDSAGKGNLRGL